MIFLCLRRHSIAKILLMDGIHDLPMRHKCGVKNSPPGALNPRAELRIVKIEAKIVKIEAKIAKIEAKMGPILGPKCAARGAA